MAEIWGLLDGRPDGEYPYTALCLLVPHAFLAYFRIRAEETVIIYEEERHGALCFREPV